MKWIAKQKRAASGAAHKTVNPPYVAIIRRIVFCMIFKLTGGKRVVKTVCRQQVHRG